MEKLTETKINSNDVRNRIKDDVNSSIFIEAGAGAGKSTSIVGRVMSQIKAGISPRRIVVITFTNKATEEILSRINKAVYEESLNPNISASDRELYKRAFKDLPGMNISTIHSFCFTILSEKSLNIKLPIGVELIEEDELNNNQLNILNKWIKSLGRDIYKLYDSNDRFQFKKIKEYYQKFCEYEDTEYEILTIDDSFKKELYSRLYDYKEKMLQYADEAKSLLESNNKPVDDAMSLCSASLNRAILGIDNVMNEYDANSFISKFDEELIPLIDDIISNIGASAKISSRKKAGGLDEIKEDSSNYSVLFKDYLKKYKAYKFVLNDAVFIEYAYKAYEYYKNNRSLLKVSNNQLLYLTNEVIKDPAARRYFANKYDVIYVDEFQDTDHIQADFIWELTKEIDEVHKSKGLEYGSLVVVGDPKQSIYRFRGADPDVFFKVKDLYKERESIIYSLTYNFRSNNLILDYVNDTYKNKDIQGNNPYEAMMYKDNHIVPEAIDDKCFAGVFNLPPFSNEEDYISCLINKLVLEEYKIPRFDKDSNTYKWDKIKYSDFMVLFSNFGGSERFINSFKKYNIPVYINGQIDFLNEHGMKVFRRVFRGLVVPFDKLSRVGAIEALRMNDYYETESEAKAIEFYNNLFSYLKQETKDMSAYGKALYLINHLNLILGDNDSYQSIRIKLQQMYENALTKNFVNGQSLVDYFDKYSESKVPNMLMMHQGVDAVRFMNAHKSKGLEAPIVIWVENSIKPHEPSYYKDNNKFIFNLDGSKEIYDKAIIEDAREKGRLEYVIATRAEQALIFSSAIVDGNLFKREGYDYGLDDLSSYQVGILPKIDIIEPQEKQLADYKALENDVYESSALICSTSPSSYENHLNKSSGKVDNNRPVGNVLGTIMHRALELMVLRGDDLFDECINIALNESCNELAGRDTQKYRRFLRAVLKATKNLYNELNIFDSAEMVEPEFTYQLYDDVYNSPFKKDDKNIDVYLNGTIDLFIKYKDRILIIDYKSDAAGYENESQYSSILRSEYSPQLEVYKESARRLFGDINNIEAKIIYYREYDYDSELIIPTIINI